MAGSTLVKGYKMLHCGQSMRAHELEKQQLQHDFFLSGTEADG
jgi:hypothetical protein